MTTEQIEAWARAVIDRVKRGEHNEDGRVELKAAWPSDPRDAARKIAGQANAAAPEPILLLVGVDEKKGVVGADRLNLADWHEQVRAHFDNAAPPLLRDHAFDLDGRTVVALLFETDAAPFVVRTGIAGAVTHEVPWREGTRTRSAGRADLLRVLSPLQRLPDVEIVWGRVRLHPTSRVAEGELRLLDAVMCVYVVPRTTNGTIVAKHRTAIRLGLGDTRWFTLPVRFGSDSPSIRIAGKDAVVEAPGAMTIEAGGHYKNADSIPTPDLITLITNFRVAGTAATIPLEIRLRRSDEIHNGVVMWGWGDPDG